MTVDHTPLARQNPRAVYGDRMVTAVDAIVTATHAGNSAALIAAVDEALTIPQPRGEDPVHWLAAALALHIPGDTDE